MIKESQISAKLAKVPIKELAAQTKFSLRSDNQMDAQNFVMGFFLMIVKGENLVNGL